MDNSTALATLREASDDFLYSHRDEAALVIRDLGDRLTRMVFSRGLDIPEIPRCLFCQGRAQDSIQVSLSDDSSRAADIGHATPGQEQRELNNVFENTAITDKHDAQEDLPAFELYTALLGEIPGLWDLIPKHLDEWIKDIYQSSDRWMIFIERLERIQKPTTEDKLYRALALRGLALQFSIFESHCPPRRNKKRDGRIPKFVRDHLCAPEKEIKRISHYIQAGQKHLKIEEAFRHELEQRQSIYAGEAYSGRGISALTALAITPFRNLQLGKIPKFVEKFFADGAKIKLCLPFPLVGPSQSIEREFCLLEVVERASRWFTELQSCFVNVTISGDRCKRRRLSSYRTDTAYAQSAMCGSVFPNEGLQNLRPAEVLHNPPTSDTPFQFGSIPGQSNGTRQATTYFNPSPKRIRLSTPGSETDLSLQGDQPPGSTDVICSPPTTPEPDTALSFTSEFSSAIRHNTDTSEMPANFLEASGVQIGEAPYQPKQQDQSSTYDPASHPNTGGLMNSQTDRVTQPALGTDLWGLNRVMSPNLDAVLNQDILCHGLAVGFDAYDPQGVAWALGRNSYVDENEYATLANSAHGFDISNHGPIEWRTGRACGSEPVHTDSENFISACGFDEFLPDGNIGVPGSNLPV